MKPSLKLSTASASVAAPADLPEPERELWARLVAVYALADPAALILLDSLVRNKQLARECREAIAVDGKLVDGRAHPLLKVLESSEKLANAALRALNLDLEPLRPASGRPPLPFGYRG